MEVPMPAAACTALTASGQSCRFPARRGAAHCINHDPAGRAEQALQRQRATEAATRARRLRAELRTTSALYAFDDWVLADRSSIQALLDAVIRMELAGRLPAARARNLLRALAIAARNFDTPRRDGPAAAAARHNLARYHHIRQSLDARLETLLAEAEVRDAART
jgi:hypothetical protein